MVNFAEGNTHASGSEDGLCSETAAMLAEERRLMRRGNYPKPDDCPRNVSGAIPYFTGLKESQLEFILSIHVEH